MGEQTVSFTTMADGTRDDYDLLARRLTPYLAEAPDRLLAALVAQTHERSSGHRVDRTTHACQTATRARNDGADVEWIVAALLHDIGDGLAPMNHDRYAAEVLRPYVRDEVRWVVGHHGAFQLYYSGPHTGRDPHTRERFRHSPYYGSCVDFCARWDQVSFDPDYPTDSLESFRDEVTEVFIRPAFDPALLREGEVVGVPG